MMNRRQFTGHLVTGAAVVAIGAEGFVLTGCTAASIFAQIQAYVPIGLLAFQGILAVIAPFVPMAGGIAIIVGLIKAAFSDLSAAVSEYQSAPAADKATALGKIKVVLGVIADQFQKFLSDLNLGSSNPLYLIVAGIVKVILSALAGFAGQLPGTPVAIKMSIQMRDGSVVQVTPKLMSIKQFKAAYNAVAVNGGHPEIELH
jgi:hypothetical protein